MFMQTHQVQFFDMNLVRNQNLANTSLNFPYHLKCQHNFFNAYAGYIIKRNLFFANCKTYQKMKHQLEWVFHFSKCPTFFSFLKASITYHEKKRCWCFTHGNGLGIWCSQNKDLFTCLQACTYFGNVMFLSCVTLQVSFI